MADASNEGYGALACDCRAEDVSGGGSGRWRFPLAEMACAEIEQDLGATGEEQELRGSPASGRRGALELPAGSSRLLVAVKELAQS
eukprot:6396046-Pyramimonas_sp.AAC.1